jgi:hypothetical protein
MMTTTSLESSSSRKTKINVCIFFFCVFALFLLIGLVVTGFNTYHDRTRPEVSNETQETFLIQNNENEPEWVGKEAARRLGRLAYKADQIVAHLIRYKLPEPEVAERLGRRWTAIRQRPNAFRETSKHETPAAYTINKGEELRICVRDRNSNQMFEDENTGFLVLLHELAHLMSVGYGHENEFHQNFAYITKIAHQLGLYQYVDYSRKPTIYCGTTIKHSPI